MIFYSKIFHFIHFFFFFMLTYIEVFSAYLKNLSGAFIMVISDRAPIPFFPYWEGLESVSLEKCITSYRFRDWEDGIFDFLQTRYHQFCDIMHFYIYKFENFCWLKRINLIISRIGLDFSSRETEPRVRFPSPPLRQRFAC